MTETTIRPESGKPNPVSYQEFTSMDFKKQMEFLNKLSLKERVAFQIVMSREYDAMPKAEKIAMQDKKIKELQAKENPSISEKVSLKQAQMHRKYLESSSHTKFPKWIRELKSPYVIGK